MWNIALSLLEFTETLLMANVHILRFVITHTPPALLANLGKVKTFVYFKATAPKIPAYKNFLKTQGITDTQVSSLAAFKKLPYTTKENYILAYALQERMLNGQLPVSGNIDESAGSTGKATMWVRSFKEEQKLRQLITFALDFTFNSFSKNNVIVLNCWSNGPWATGIKFAFIAQHSTLVKAIGTNKENVIDTIQTFGKNCEYIICGYPPFTKEIIDYGEQVGMKWSDYKINIVTGGEGFSEGWRDFMREKIKGSGGEVYSAYGASDIDIGVAFETDFAIAVRRKLTEDQQFRAETLGDARIPLFVGQYNPLVYYIEESFSGELVFTLINQHTASPKIRYNLGDAGRVLSFQDTLSMLSPKEQQTYKGNKSLKLPMVIVYGRSDGTVSLDGANIYPADVQHALYTSSLASYVHSFFLDTTYDHEKTMNFTVHIEMKEGTAPSEISEKMVNESAITMAAYLSTVNKDYRESLKNNSKSLTPNIQVHQYGHELFRQNTEKIKHVYYDKSKQKKR